MSDIKDLIRETNKNAKRSRLINNILWGVVSILMCVAMYTTSLSISSKNEAVYAKNEAVAEKNAKKELLVIADSLRVQAEELVGELQITEENLQGEKDKLEKIKVKYDSIREITLKKSDDLWLYAQKENTVEAYTDYVKIKGINDVVVSKIKTLLQNTGYMQIQESSGAMLIEPINQQHGLWKAKSARSIRLGVIGNKSYPNSERNGDVILEGQPFVILEDSLMTGKARWAKIAY
jgi:hypothetical protein